MDNKNKDTQIGIRIPEDVKGIIQRVADEDQMTISWMARKLLHEALEN